MHWDLPGAEFDKYSNREVIGPALRGYVNLAPQLHGWAQVSTFQAAAANVEVVELGENTIARNAAV